MYISLAETVIFLFGEIIFSYDSRPRYHYGLIIFNNFWIRKDCNNVYKKIFFVVKVSLHSAFGVFFFVLMYFVISENLFVNTYTENDCFD